MGILRKVKSSMLVITILGMILTGCSKGEIATTNNKGDSIEENKTGNATKEEKKYTYNMVMHNFGPWDEDPKMIKYWEEYFGDVEFNLQYVEVAQASEKINLLIASKQIPDIMQMINRDQLMKQGVLGGWTEEFFREKAPNLTKMIEETDSTAFEYAKLDGNLMYSIPGFRAFNNIANPVIWRDDWLKKVGINEIPKTLGQAEEAFYKFVKEDPDGNGKDDTYGLSKTGFDTIYGAFGTMTGNWIENPDGTLVYGEVKPEMKEALTLLNKWYKDGIIDPEFITGENEGGYWAISHAFTKGKIGLTGIGQWYHWHPECEETGAVSACDKEFRVANPSGSYEIGYPLEGPTGAKGTKQGDSRTLRTYFSKELTEDEGKFGRLLEIIDILNGGEMEQQLTTTLGIKGEDWDYLDLDGNKVTKMIDPKLAEDVSYGNAMGAGNTLAFIEEGCSPDTQLVRYGDKLYWGYDFFKDKSFGYVNPVYVTVPAAAQYQAELNKLMEEAFISIITGDKPVEYFDEVVQQWYSNGGEQITREVNEWYKTIKQ